MASKLSKEFLRMRRIVFLLSTAAVFAFRMCAADAELPRKAPELAFTLPGKGETLLSQLRGKVVALEFILTTCPHCQAASRVMTGYQQEYGSRGFQAIDVAINGLDEGRTPRQADALVQAFSSNFQVGFPVGWIPRDQFMNFMGFSLASYTVVPQLVLIDRKGFIHYQTPPRGEENAMKPEVIRQRIEELLALPAGPSAKSRSAVAKKSY